jgi:hypothetical protein
MGIRQDHEKQAIEDLRNYGRSLVGTVSIGRTEAVVGRALIAGRRRHRPRGLVLAFATLGLLAISNAGLAAVSDAAAPGDLLYPLDRGYERATDLFGGWLFGVGDRTQERLAESETLNLRGDTEEAIALLRDELTLESSDAELLVAAIDQLESQSSQGPGSQNDPGPATPAQTAPGQVNDEGNGQNQPNPSDTAPGNGQDDEVGGSPSDDAPGQNKDKESKDNPSDDAPGQTQDPTTTSVAPGTGNGNNGQGNENGNNGNNGQGNNGP